MMGPATNAAIQRVLGALRTHFGLDLAFVAEFTQGQRVIRYVEAGPGVTDVQVGDTAPLEDTFCYQVASGNLAGLLQDPSADPRAAVLEDVNRLPRGTRLVVPIHLADGSIFGTCCGEGNSVLDRLDDRDLATMRMAADVIAPYLADNSNRRKRQERRRAWLAGMTEGTDLLMVFQPIVQLSGLRRAGFEALARFPRLVAGPAEMFAEARNQGLEVEFELKAVRAALEHVPDLPDRAFLSVNVSPNTIGDERLLDAVRAAGPERVVVEITEHAAVLDYDRLLRAVKELSNLGARLAIDDVGKGISGLHHILRLSPHIVKIDAVLVRDIHVSPAKQALISALVTFAARTRIALIAEGIECHQELQALEVLGVEFGQGHHISRPHAKALVA